MDIDIVFEIEIDETVRSVLQLRIIVLKLQNWNSDEIKVIH